MKYKKWLPTLVASCAFFSFVGATDSSNSQVEATSLYTQKAYTKYANKFHKVVILKNTQVYKVHRGKDEAHNIYIKAYMLHPGDVATIRDRGVAWGWTIGKKYNYCSMRDPFSFSWFDTYQRHYYIDYGLFHGAKKRVNKSYTFTWNQYCKLVKMGMWDLMYHPYGATHNKIMKQIKQWDIKAS
ncbi:hypothetical protein [uncultured Lactobacillus sp.]|uniref:hypothetical protein n=1 Tax=uncultured Lactobacillus sp. TaxID=153152 RepID=UPI00260563B3|nr:hypothetical protein [uncultured Lactobacillus sp.]